MAKITDVFVNGTLGNLVFYTRNGKACVRMRTLHINHTEATKKRSANFGIAARAGSGLREGLREVMPSPTNRSAQSRISGAISKWLGQSDVNTLEPNEQVPFIGNLAFVADKGFFTRFKVPVQISRPEENLIRVKTDAFIPTRLINAPAKTVTVKMILSVSGCLLPKGDHTGDETQTMEIPYNGAEIPALEFDFHVPMPPKSLTVTAGRLIYYQSKGQMLPEIDNPAFMAAGTIDARYR
jgi:hypothetical protein